jgi:hypothetical protein
MADALCPDLLDRFPHVLWSSPFPGVNGYVQSGLARLFENAGEWQARIIGLIACQIHADHTFVFVFGSQASDFVG